MKRIGLIGKNGAGKSIACDYFKESGYTVFSLSDSLRIILKSEGKPLDRDTITKRANQLKSESGMAVLATKGWDETSGKELVVFDSIRHPDEAVFLKSKGVFLIGVTASLETRYQRISNRGGATDEVDFEKFKRQDTFESDGSSSGQYLDKTFKLCDTVLKNDGTIEELYQTLKTIIKETGCLD